jgi:hypothetical protein
MATKEIERKIAVIFYKLITIEAQIFMGKHIFNKTV